MTISSPIFATPPITSPKWTVTIGFWTTSTRTGACRYAVVVAEWCDIPLDAKTLRRGKERRAFLSDPTHKHVFHFTPKHGSWLNQVELWFGVLGRRFLAQGDFRSAEDFEARLRQFLDDYNDQYAHPYRWTYTGKPLVRDTPFSRTRRQEQHGRAWFSPRPRRFERLLYSPRPYRRKQPA